MFNVVGCAAVALLRDIGEVIDVEGHVERGTELVAEADVDEFALDAVEVSRGRDGVVGGEEGVRVVHEQARGKSSVAPAEAGVGGDRNEVRHLALFAPAGAAEVTVGIKQRVIDATAEAFEHAGEERELLLIAKFPALHHGGAGVGGGEDGPAGVFAVEAVISAGCDDTGFDATDDVVADLFVEPAGREVADGLEIILERGVPVLRGLRQEGRVVDREGGAAAEVGVGLIGRLAGHEIAEAGTAKTRGPA